MKCDIHRHLGGSISPDTVWEIAKRTDGIGLTYEQLVKRMSCHQEFGIGFSAFLDKFKVLDEIEWPDWAIDLAIKQVCKDLSKEGIDYSEISLSLNKYVQNGLYSGEDAHLHVADYLYDCFERYTTMFDVKVGLLLSLRYDSPRDQQLRYASIIENKRRAAFFVGIDLVGDEVEFDADFYRPILQQWHDAGKATRAHVGEMPGTEKNVEIAIYNLPVTRLAHGIHATDEVFSEAAKRGIVFDLAIHSNLTTGAVSDIIEHPMKHMLQMGCKVTLNTDDPTQFGCTLDDEFRLALDNGLITESQAKDIMANACEAAQN